MAESHETLVSRRPRRSTAGNRMAEALAEMALVDVGKEADDDNDFVNKQDEEDIFESDFESTDEETAQAELELVDQVINDEEKRARRAARSKLERVTAAAHARNKTNFNPQTYMPSSGTKTKRRLSTRMLLDVDTVGTIAHDSDAIGEKKRQSQRRHTIQNTSATVRRMKKSEEKKDAAAPKRSKTETRVFTQEELIARALDNEEGNIVEHRDYLQIEEEKRRRAQVVRTTVEGPLLRWVSRKEEIRVPLQIIPQITSTLRPAYVSHEPPISMSTILSPSPSGAGTPVGNPMRLPDQRFPHAAAGAARLLPDQSEIATKNYVIHELNQIEGVPNPSWNESMRVMFGDHVEWDQLKVYIGKNRPMSRPRPICPISGRPAKYLDPRTGVPYANLKAYETLTAILRHEYIWSPALKCYIKQ
ncbi:YL1 nuclear protein-domain-containing protein [Infundibulicybe gibba]|nr:YL1 nuclear protein-domain-containing protein [Infundibulicybe gibba]